MMRLQEVYFICKKALDGLPEYRVQEMMIAGKAETRYVLYDWGFIDAILTDLYQVKGMRDSIDAFRAVSGTLRAGSTQTMLTGEERAKAFSSYKALLTALRAIVGTYESFHIPDRTDGIDLKMPDGVTLEELTTLCKDISLALSQCPALNQADDDIRLIGADVGSFWLSLALIGPHLLNRFASFVDKCFALKSHYVTTKAMESQYRLVANTNNYLDDMLKVHKDLAKRLAEQCARDFYEENGTTQNDDIARTQMAIDTFGRVLAQGVEVYPAVGSSDATKALFPTVEQQCLQQKAIQYLEPHVKSTEESDNLESVD